MLRSAHRRRSGGTFGVNLFVVVVGVSVALVGCAQTRLDPVPSSQASVPPPPSGSVAVPPPSASPSISPSSPPVFDRSALSVDASNSLWVVVNKLRPLSPLNYEPQLVTAQVRYISNPQMRPEAASSLSSMFAAAATEGGGAMQIQNAYRSFATQTSVHNRLVSSLGETKADAQSARPGFSEHQTGLAVDVAALPEKCSIQACFGQTPQGVWLAANAWRFGFVVRYPAVKTPITGYVYEPWHLRFIGVDAATEMHTTGTATLEEFFGLPAAPDYAP